MYITFLFPLQPFQRAWPTILFFKVTHVHTYTQCLPNSWISKVKTPKNENKVNIKKHYFPSKIYLDKWEPKHIYAVQFTCDAAYISAITHDIRHYRKLADGIMKLWCVDINNSNSCLKFVCTFWEVVDLLFNFICLKHLQTACCWCPNVLCVCSETHLLALRCTASVHVHWSLGKQFGYRTGPYTLW